MKIKVAAVLSLHHFFPDRTAAHYTLYANFKRHLSIYHSFHSLFFCSISLLWQSSNSEVNPSTTNQHTFDFVRVMHLVQVRNKMKQEMGDREKDN